MMLAKTVKRTVNRITSFSEPIGLNQIYTKGYFLLIAAMMILASLMRVFRLPLDIRGTIDIAIGSALMNGALIYFRYAEKKQAKAEGNHHL
jgi:hypothetical protein